MSPLFAATQWTGWLLSFRQFLQAPPNLGQVGGGEVPELGGFDIYFRFHG